MLLSHLVATPRSASGHAKGGRAAKAGHASAPGRRVTPAAEITAAYKAFLADFAAVESSYVQAINDQSSGSVTVSAQLTQPYAAGASAMVVDNASVFGPLGTFTTPVIATATIGGVSNGTQYVFTGRSDSHTLIVNPGQSAQAPLTPPGVALNATVPSTSQTSGGDLSQLHHQPHQPDGA